MALAHTFDYQRPSTLIEALQLKAKYKDKAHFLAGGTDLIVNIREGMLKPDLLIDIKGISELLKLNWEKETLFIGSNVTFAQLIENELVQKHFILLHDACKTIGSTGIRARATLTGNICSAVPSLDSAPALLCYEAKVHCASPESQREIPVTEWFLAPRKTALQEDEIVTGISLKRIPDSSGIYLKLGRYSGEDLAQAGWGILMTADKQYRLAHCALSPIPKRAYYIEDLLNNSNPLNADLIEKAIALIPSEINPITDIRATQEFRMYISGIMLKRGLTAIQERISGKHIEPRKLLGDV